MSRREQINAYAYRHHGNWTAIANALKENEEWKPIHTDHKFTTIVDSDYPPAFRRLRYPPWIIYYKGNLDLAETSICGIVGSRKCTQRALDNTREITEILSRRHTIVSGLASGIDAAAHQAATTSIGIIGCGLDRIYPRENAVLYRKLEKCGLILTEYPPGTPPFARHFPWRNRLIAALSEFVVIPECEIRSGTMHTVDACNELSVPIYCLATPYGQPDHQGCDWLISQGAGILYEPAQLDEL